MKGQLLWDDDAADAVASNLAEEELYTVRVLTTNDHIKKYDAVTPADLQRLAQQLFVTEALNLAAVGPFGGESRLRKLLKL